VASATTSAAAKAASTPPVSRLRVKHRLSPSSGWISGVAGSSAVCISVTAGRSCHSTCRCCSASSACARVSATTATTGSPCQQARSIASACCGADFMPARWPSVATHGWQTVATSAPSTIAITPGIARAASRVILTMRQCATGERQYTTCAMRGSLMSTT